ncbi:MAG: FAD-binding protein [Actinobacteria bacterium]|nr:FAD-binding protein [Actinomycetota bacterium]
MTPFTSSNADCDVIIVGSGPGGATAAEVLTAAGMSVIILEKGRNHLVSLDAPYRALDHFANDEIAARRRNLFGPDPLLEPRTFRRNENDGDHLFVGEVNNLPSTVGGLLVAPWRELALMIGRSPTPN